MGLINSIAIYAEVGIRILIFINLCLLIKCLLIYINKNKNKWRDWYYVSEKKLKSLSLIMVSLMMCLMTSVLKTNALDNEHIKESGYIEIDLNDLNGKDSIVLYQGDGYTVSIDILDTISTFDTGNSGWSGGTIPSGTTTLYPHVTSTGTAYDEIGFYMTVRNKEILDVYGENVDNRVIISVSDVEAKIINKKASVSRTAKASMTFLARYTIGGGSWSNYLTAEINNRSQFRVSWSF